MAHIEHEGPSVAAAAAAFLRDGDHGREELRARRSALSHVTAELGDIAIDDVRPAEVRALLDRLRDAGLPPARLAAVADAVRALYAYAIDHGLARTSPAMGLSAPAAEGSRARARPRDDAPGDGEDEDQGPSPTTAILQLGNRVATWTVTLLLLALVVLVVELTIALR